MFGLNQAVVWTLTSSLQHLDLLGDCCPVDDPVWSKLQLLDRWANVWTTEISVNSVDRLFKIPPSTLPLQTVILCSLLLVSSPKCAAIYCLLHLRSSATPYRRGCVNITTLQCDLTFFNISAYGRYLGRVRALLGAEASPWVESNFTTLDKESESGSHTQTSNVHLDLKKTLVHNLQKVILISFSVALIGPPNVSLHPNGPTLEVTIKDPVFHISSLRSVYHRVTYNITYWKKGQKEQVGFRLNRLEFQE